MIEKNEDILLISNAFKKVRERIVSFSEIEDTIKSIMNIITKETGGKLVPKISNKLLKWGLFDEKDNGKDAYDIFFAKKNSSSNKTIKVCRIYVDKLTGYPLSLELPINDTSGKDKTSEVVICRNHNELRITLVRLLSEEELVFNFIRLSIDDDDEIPF